MRAFEFLERARVPHPTTPARFSRETTNGRILRGQAGVDGNLGQRQILEQTSERFERLGVAPDGGVGKHLGPNRGRHVLGVEEGTGTRPFDEIGDGRVLHFAHQPVDLGLQELGLGHRPVRFELELTQSGFGVGKLLA